MNSQPAPHLPDQPRDDSRPAGTTAASADTSEASASLAADRDAAPRAVWVWRGVVKAATALQLSVGDDFTAGIDGSVDRTVARCPQTGLPRLPGSSLAGALRRHAADRHFGYSTSEPAAASPATAVFGGVVGDYEGEGSRLTVHHMVAEPGPELAGEVRTRTAVDPDTGRAADTSLRDEELVAAGAHFVVAVELVVADVDDATAHHTGMGNDPCSVEAALVAEAAAALDALAAGDLPVGGGTTRGYGRVENATSGAWQAVRYDLRCADGWTRWLAADDRQPGGSASGVSGAATPTEAAEAAAAGTDVAEALRLRIGQPPVSRARRAAVELNLTFDTLLISGGEDPHSKQEGGVDAQHLYSAGKAVLPGSSVAGALRSHATRVLPRFAEAAGVDAAQARHRGDAVVDALFGPRGDAETLAASPLRFADAFASRGKLRSARGGGVGPQARVPIDRWTRATLDTALVSLDPLENSAFPVPVELRLPETSAEKVPGSVLVGALLLLLRELRDGQVAVGGHAAIGYGTARTENSDLLAVLDPLIDSAAASGGPHDSDTLTEATLRRINGETFGGPDNVGRRPAETTQVRVAVADACLKALHTHLTGGDDDGDM